MEDLESTFIEEYEGAVEQFEKGRYKNATILFSKSLFALCDLMLYSRLSKLPKNHSERFRMLERFFPDVYVIVDSIFGNYTDAYSKPILKETCEEIINGIRKIAKADGVPEQIKKAVE